jgi:hypothetical protein
MLHAKWDAARIGHFNAAEVQRSGKLPGHVRADRAPFVGASASAAREESGVVVIVADYRGFRLEIVAQFVEGAWNAGVRIRRTLSDMKPHVEQVTCRKATAIEAEQAGEIWGERWVDRHTEQAGR